MMAFALAAVFTCLALRVVTVVSGSEPAASAESVVRFANPLGDHMVLQAGESSQVWGFGPPGSPLVVTLQSSVAGTPARVVRTTVSAADGSWLARLPEVLAQPGTVHPTYTITASARGAENGENATLTDVLFGDVFVCGGQSNMQFSVGNASNATAEIAAAAGFAHIRLMTAGRAIKQPLVPQAELPYVEQQWSVANEESVGGPWGSNFSAVCWFFGPSIMITR